MRQLLLFLLLAASALANGCQCQYNSSQICLTDMDCTDSGSCLCPTTSNGTITLITTTPSPPTGVDTITQATEQQYVEATLGSLSDGESAGWIIGMMLFSFAFVGIMFFIGWMRVA